MRTQISGSGSTIQLFGSGLQLHSPGWNQLFLEMNTYFGSLFLQMQLHSFRSSFFLRKLHCPFISLALKYFQSKVIFVPKLKS